jgi:hypothetical protein
VDASSTCGKSRNLDRALGVFMAEMIRSTASGVVGRMAKITRRDFAALSPPAHG